MLLGSLARPVQHIVRGSARRQAALAVQYPQAPSPALLTQTGLTDRLMFTALFSGWIVLFK